MTAAALLDDLAQALLDEEQARVEVRAARRKQARLLRELRALGLPATRVVHRLGAAQGVAWPVADRLRLARRLRKRAERETACRVDHAGAHGPASITTASSDWAMTPDSKEDPMTKLVKRTVVEEFLEEKEPENRDVTEEDLPDDVEDAEDQDIGSVRRRR